ncbi:hypothetical protein P7C70_g6148, partial [Phenoliferia sp. Uapishka_3]
MSTRKRLPPQHSAFNIAGGPAAYAEGGPLNRRSNGVKQPTRSFSTPSSTTSPKIDLSKPVSGVHPSRIKAVPGAVATPPVSVPRARPPQSVATVSAPIPVSRVAQSQPPASVQPAWKDSLLVSTLLESSLRQPATVGNSASPTSPAQSSATRVPMLRPPGIPIQQPASSGVPNAIPPRPPHIPETPRVERIKHPATQSNGPSRTSSVPLSHLSASAPSFSSSAQKQLSLPREIPPIEGAVGGARTSNSEIAASQKKGSVSTVGTVPLDLSATARKELALAEATLASEDFHAPTEIDSEVGSFNSQGIAAPEFLLLISARPSQVQALIDAERARRDDESYDDSEESEESASTSSSAHIPPLFSATSSPTLPIMTTAPLSQLPAPHYSNSRAADRASGLGLELGEGRTSDKFGLGSRGSGLATSALTGGSRVLATSAITNGWR